MPENKKAHHSYLSCKNMQDLIKIIHFYCCSVVYADTVHLSQVGVLTKWLIAGSRKQYCTTASGL